MPSKHFRPRFTSQVIVLPSLWRLFVLLAVLIMVAGSPRAAPIIQAACANGLSVSIIAAPFAVVDSNKPGIEGPRAAMLAARITNNSAGPLSDITVHIGNGLVPGAFAATAGGGLSLLQASDASHFLGELASGASITSFWPVTYPTTFNTSYSYTIWTTSPDGCSASAASQIATQSEIGAISNKLLPGGSLVLLTPGITRPGSLITARLNGFSLGSIGQGPQGRYDAWLQPVGNLDFDPTCLRLAHTEVKLNSISATPFVDQLYFSGLTHYTSNSSDYAAYTFVALRECQTFIQPYQEASSGTQEKYNGDYSSNTTRIAITSSGEADLILQATSSSASASAGAVLQLGADFSSSGAPIGYPDNGSPVVITAPIPPETSYVAGSATADLPADIEFSTNNGQTWASAQPAAPETISHVRWLFRDPLGMSPGQVRYNVAVNNAYNGATLHITITGSLLNAEPLAASVVVINGVAPPPPDPTIEPTPEPVVQSGVSGGLESRPLSILPSVFLSDRARAPIAPISTTQALSPASENRRPGESTIPGLVADPSALIGSIGEDNSAAPPISAAYERRIQPQSTLALTDLLPTIGPNGTTASTAIPADVLATTNVPDAKAVNFVDSAGRVKAVVLGIQSLNGPYEHDYGVCNRFKEYDFDLIEPVAIGGLNGATTAWFWHSRATRDAEIREEALIYQIFVDQANRRFTIDSRWIQDAYPDDPGFAFDYVFNMQIWSTDFTTSQMLLQAINERLVQIDGGAWQVHYLNQQQPVAPTVFARSVDYQADTIHLTLQNNAASSRTVRIYGSWRSHLDRTTSAPFEYLVELPSGRNRLSIGFVGLLDATIYLESSGFTDKVYAGGGLWFSLAKTDTSSVTMTIEQCRDLSGLDQRDLLVAGCASVSGGNVSSADRIGLGRTLNPNGRVVDVSRYRAVRFWARGNGSPMRLLIEMQSITDGDFYQVAFTPAAEWRQYVIPINEFSQRGFGVPQPFTGVDVKSLLWMNADSTAGAFSLAIDQISFTNSSLLRLIDKPSDNADTNDRSVVAAPMEGGAVEQVTLFYSLDDGATFSAAPLNASGGQFGGWIPGQPLGSEVLFYLEGIDSNGYVSHSPVDAPVSLHRYRIDDRTGLLVDDFAGGRLRNRLDRLASLFNSPNNGGRLRAYQFERRLLLDYDVGQNGQLAGYVTSLGRLNAKSYASLDILLRGSGHMLVGLRDANGNEPRLSVGDLTPGGITTDWQWVQLPLAAFSGPLDFGALERISFTFDGSYAPTAGLIEIKEVRFSTLPIPLTIDTFDDGNDLLNSRGLAHWTAAPNAQLSSVYSPGDAIAAGGAALRLDYSVQADGYALWSSELGGAVVPEDARLSFWVKGNVEGLMPNLYLTDGLHRARVSLDTYAIPSAAWQRVSIPLSVFTAQGLDRTNLQAFQMAWEFGAGAGSLWLDNISIGVAGTPKVDRRVLHITDTNSQAIALHTPNSDRWSISSDSAWLFAPTQGFGPSSLNVRVVAWGMAPGEYVGTLRINTAEAQADTIMVYLRVTTVGSAPVHVYAPLMFR